jgi:hypothetical protein
MVVVVEDSLENDNLCSFNIKEEDVGVGKGELGVVEGVESGGNVITGLFIVDNLAISPKASAANFTSGSSISILFSCSLFTSCVMDIGDEFILFYYFEEEEKERKKKRTKEGGFHTIFIFWGE